MNQEILKAKEGATYILAVRPGTRAPVPPLSDREPVLRRLSELEAELRRLWDVVYKEQEQSVHTHYILKHKIK